MSEEDEFDRDDSSVGAMKEPSITETLVDKHLIGKDSESGTLEYAPEGTEDIEAAYKIQSFLLDNPEEYREEFGNRPLLESITLTRLYNDIIELYNNLDDYKEDRLSERDELREVHEASEEQFREELNNVVDLIFRVETSDDMLLFFTLARETVSKICSDIINRQLFVDSRSNDDLDSLAAAEKIDITSQVELLYFTETIGRDLRDNLFNIRVTRNRLLHEMPERHFLDSQSDIESVMSIVDRAMNSLGTLHEIAYGHWPWEPIGEVDFEEN